MANLKTTFSDGTGDLSVVYTGENNDSPKVSADTNCGEDRSVQLTVQTTEGDTVIQKTVTISQVGVREQFIPADETEGIICADGERFLTIKEEYSGENYPEDCGISTMNIDMANIDADSIKESVEQLGGDNRVKIVVTDESGSNNWTALESLFKEGETLSNYNIWLDLSNLENIPSNTFNEVSGITKLTANKGIIESSTFGSVSTIKEVIIPEGCTEIGKGVFSFCENLETVTISNSVTSIMSYSFSICNNMKNLTIGSGVKDIGISVFSACSNLENIKFLGTEEPSIGEGTFYNVSASICVPNDYEGEKFGSLNVVKNCQ